MAHLIEAVLRVNKIDLDPLINRPYNVATHGVTIKGLAL